MILEITNYVENIAKDYAIKNYLYGKPKKGIHIQIYFKDIINIQEIKDLSDFLKNIDYFIFDDNKEFFKEISKEIIEYEFQSEYIDNNKSIGDKNIFSNNPFVIETKIGLKKGIQMDLNKLAFIFKEKKEIIKKYYNILEQEYSDGLPENLIKKISEFTQNLSKSDFWGQYINLENWLDEFKETRLDMEKDRIIIIFLFSKINKQSFDELFNISIKNYFDKKGFNKDDYNFELNNKLYGLSGYLNGDNSKKPFLKHLTTPFKINNRIPAEIVKTLIDFEKFVGKKVLPNPLPIFIDKEELNKKTIEIFKENKEIKFKELIKKLYEKHKEDLGNYYLLYFEKGTIRDIDYVSNFRYKLEDFSIKTFQQIFSKESENEIQISDIFELESHILNMFFSNKYLEKSNINLYFSSDFKDSTLNVAFLPYRPLLFNFIYKSKQEWMQNYQWKKICESALMYHLRKDKGFDKTSIIQKILRTYFSLNHHFDKTNKNFGGFDMPTKLPELNNKVREIISSEEEIHFSSDEEFAFGAGQLIYYLLWKSETADKTHQLLEPFLNKHRIAEFKKALERIFEYYKHEISFRNSRFNRLAREVFGYETEKDLSDFKPFILAGYFAKNLILEKKQENESNV